MRLIMDCIEVVFLDGTVAYMRLIVDDAKELRRQQIMEYEFGWQAQILYIEIEGE